MLDFKGWKKIAEDKKTVTMKHPKGHSMIIALKGLPKLHQEKLKRLKLDEGTPDGDLSTTATNFVNKMKDPTAPQQAEAPKSGSVFSGIFGPSKAAAAADVPPPQQNTDLSGTATNFFERMKKSDGGKIQKFADGSAQPIAPVLPAPNSSLQSVEPAPVQVPTAPQTPNVLLPNGSMSAPGTAQTGQAGIDLNSQIASEKAKADVVYQQEALKERQRLNNIDAQKIADLKGHTDDFANYFKTSPIRSNAYLEDMSAGKKMGTALGLLLSGAGSGMSGQSNMAMDFLNKQIDRNIDAQKANSDNQKTVWGAYHSLYGEQNVANNLAKVSMNDMLVHQAAITAAQLGTPTAQANAMALKSQKAAENNKLILDSAGLLSSTPNVPHGTSAVSKTAPVGGGQAAPEAPSVSKESTDAAYNSVGIDPNSPDRENQLAKKGYNTRDVQEYARRMDSRKGIFGPSSANASHIPQAPKNPIYNILTPDAEHKLHNNVQQGTPRAREDYPSVLDQYTKAQQAEKVLNGPNGDGTGGIHDLMQRMYTNSGSGGYLSGIPSHLRNTATGALSAIPEVGPALAGLTKVIPRGEAQKEYDSNKTVLETDLATALQGLVAPTDINKIVEANLPAYKDTPEDIERKTQAIVNMVIKGAKTSQLHNYKMIKK